MPRSAMMPDATFRAGSARIRTIAITAGTAPRPTVAGPAIDPAARATSIGGQNQADPAGTNSPTTHAANPTASTIDTQSG